MDYYLDITVLPDPEFKETVLLNALFAKLHRALGQLGEGKIGVSFPRFGKTLGDQLRLHGTAASLDRLMACNWTQGLKDYTAWSELSPVPADVQYRTVRRIQKKSAHNKRKRSIHKGWLTEEEAKLRIPDAQQQTLKLPYTQIKSLSNGNSMRVYIEHGKIQPQAVPGEFSSYGLSPTATIPWF